MSAQVADRAHAERRLLRSDLRGSERAIIQRRSINTGKLHFSNEPSVDISPPSEAHRDQQAKLNKEK